MIEVTSSNLWYLIAYLDFCREHYYITHLEIIQKPGEYEDINHAEMPGDYVLTIEIEEHIDE